MAKLVIDGPDLVVELAAHEHVLGLLRDLRVPVSSISSARIVDRARDAMRGRRVGYGGLFLSMGTWWSLGKNKQKQFVVAHTWRPALAVELTDCPYATVIVETDDLVGDLDRITVVAGLKGIRTFGPASRRAHSLAPTRSSYRPDWTAVVRITPVSDTAEAI